MLPKVVRENFALSLEMIGDHFDCVDADSDFMVRLRHFSSHHIRHYPEVTGGILLHGDKIPPMMGESDRRLEAALGYLQLGIFEEANDEIQQLATEENISPGVLRLRAAIYSEAKSWDLLQEVAGFLVDSLPGDPQHWIWLAYATRRTISIPDAGAILLRALESRPSGGTIHFNLACYTAQTGRIEEAKERLRKATLLAPETRLLALDEPDLEPLW